MYEGCFWCNDVDPDPENDPSGARLPDDIDATELAKIVKGCLMDGAACTNPLERSCFICCLINLIVKLQF